MPLLELQLPVVVPRRPARRLRLRLGVLDGDAPFAVDAVLLHRHAVQVATVAGARSLGQAELLAGVVHALVLAHAGALAVVALGAQEQQPRAVDGPVPQVAVAAHAQRRRDHARVQQAKVPLHVDDLGVLRLPAPPLALLLPRLLGLGDAFRELAGAQSRGRALEGGRGGGERAAGGGRDGRGDGWLRESALDGREEPGGEASEIKK